jgi:hypothetical protein
MRAPHTDEVGLQDWGAFCQPFARNQREALTAGLWHHIGSLHVEKHVDFSLLVRVSRDAFDCDFDFDVAVDLSYEPNL